MSSGSAGPWWKTAPRSSANTRSISARGKPDILGSADPAFRGDPKRWNPEDLFLASLSACHKLWYLHFCAVSGVIVTAYEDQAEGTMQMDSDGGGRFTEIVLKPRVTIKAGTYPELALELEREGYKELAVS